MTEPLFGPQGLQSVTREQLNAMLGQRVAPAPYIDRFQVGWGSAISPSVISSVFDQANIGYGYLQADLFDEVRATDPQVQTVLSKRELMVAGAPYQCTAADPADPEAVRIASWCTTELQGIAGVRTALAHLQGAVYYGHAVTEQLWVPVRGRWRLAKIQSVHPRRFAWAARDWRMYLWDQTGNEVQPAEGLYPGLPLDVFPPGKFAVHLPRTRGGYPQREGLGRVIAWFSCFKRFDIRDWLALCEWAGRGLRKGTYKTGTDGSTERALPEHQQALRDALNAISSSLSVIIPDTTELEIVELKHTNQVHEALLRMCDEQTSKVVLGGTLTTDAGTKGARSLGDTQRDDQIMLAAFDAVSLAETVRAAWLAPMVRYEFGAGAPVPLFAFQVEEGEDLNALANRYDKLAHAGAEIPQAHVAKVFSYPLPKPGEKILVPRRINATDATGGPVQTVDDTTVAR